MSHAWVKFPCMIELCGYHKKFLMNVDDKYLVPEIFVSELAPAIHLSFLKWVNLHQSICVKYSNNENKS